MQVLADQFPRNLKSSLYQEASALRLQGLPRSPMWLPAIRNGLYREGGSIGICAFPNQSVGFSLGNRDCSPAVCVRFLLQCSRVAHGQKWGHEQSFLLTVLQTQRIDDHLRAHETVVEFRRSISIPTPTSLAWFRTPKI